jgi:hypothetical protein
MQIAGTGVAGNTVMVTDGTTIVCMSSVTADGAWSCSVPIATTGAHTLVATQVSATSEFSIPSASVYLYFGPALTGRLNDDNPGIFYTGSWKYNSNRGFGDYLKDVHYTAGNNDKMAVVFTGTSIQVFGEQNTDQGNLGISIDGGPQQTVSTLPTDGQRHANVAIFTSPMLASGQHSIVVTKLSGSYATIDGVNIAP